METLLRNEVAEDVFCVSLHLAFICFSSIVERLFGISVSLSEICLLEEFILRRVRLAPNESLRILQRPTFHRTLALLNMPAPNELRQISSAIWEVSPYRQRYQGRPPITEMGRPHT